MTARTLEEIEALAREATPGPYEISACHGGAELMLLGGPSRKYVASIRIHQVPRHMGEWEEKKRTKTAELLESLPDLLAIAQGQREELERLRANASTAAFDKINDQLREANRENEELRGLLGNAGQADIERQYCNCNP